MRSGIAGTEGYVGTFTGFYLENGDESTVFYGIFDRMKNNIELFLCVQAEDVEYLLEILDRDWKEANRKLIGIRVL